MFKCVLFPAVIANILRDHHAAMFKNYKGDEQIDTLEGASETPEDAMRHAITQYADKEDCDMLSSCIKYQPSSGLVFLMGIKFGCVYEVKRQ